MAAQILNSKEGAPHYLAKIDVDKAKSLQEKLGVTSYPTLIWFV
jgi:thioredoxin-like negative regulator of GroEL